MTSTTTLPDLQKQASTRLQRPEKPNAAKDTALKAVNQLELSSYGITVKTIHRNPSPPQLYEHAIRYEPGSSIADSGALVAYSGNKTGRSPRDKRIVKHPDSEGDVWWGTVNIPMNERAFQLNRERAIDYLNLGDRLYVIDAFAE